MINKTKTMTIAEDKWESKKYSNIIVAHKGDYIRLHMCQVNCSYKSNNQDTKFPKFRRYLPHNICWNVKKLTISNLVKKAARKIRKR